MYNVNDHSTEYVNRNTGENLTGTKLAMQQPRKMIEMILKKAGIISYTRLLRILQDGCYVAKITTPQP